MTIHFDEQLHIDCLRNALWSRPTFGKASVLIGSGFSQNAIPVSNTTLPLPTWRRLATMLIDDLYPVTGSTEDERTNAVRDACTTSGSLRAAQEYLAAFGPEKLNNKLSRSIPDTQYRPGRLHELLLSLPWADVFTTNYDTLLERAKENVLDRCYDLVLTQDDIPNSQQPRIVKLHGSFPSTRPFIITEDHFRKYPSDFAAFVNMIQQSIMENVFCLLGFSGDDPNFLQWTGWVRDNLGKACPQIYLCGFLELTMAQRKLLNDRHVIPIDLSPVFPRCDFPDNKARHALGIEWLLLNFEKGKPPRTASWPLPDRRAVSRPSSPRIPEVPSAEWPDVIPERKTFSVDPFGPEEAEQLIECWRENRGLYPGWLVLPNQNRHDLWQNTECWIEPILEHGSSLEPRLRIRLLFELNWRLERCLVPLKKSIVDAINIAIKESEQFLEIDGAIAERTADAQTVTDREQIRIAWAHLKLAVVRFHRERCEMGLYSDATEAIQRILPYVSDIEGQLHYQKCLASLEQMNRIEAIKLANKWPAEDNDPFWRVRQAAILDEAGDRDSAKRIADDALKDIRSRLTSGSGDVFLMSREAYCMQLIRRLSLLRAHDEDADHPGRWETLSTHRCDPLSETTHLLNTLRRPGVQDNRGLTDPWRNQGVVSDSSRYSSDEEAVATHTIRFLEDSANLMQDDVMTTGAVLLRRSVDVLAFYEPKRAVGPLLRLKNHGDFKAFYNSHRLARTAEATVVEIHGWAIASLNEALSNAAEPIRGHAFTRIRIPLEMMATLANRLPPQILKEDVRVAAQLYESSPFQHSAGLQHALSEFLRQVLDHLPRECTNDVLRQLITLPLPGIDGFPEKSHDHWPEPMLPPTNLVNSDARTINQAAWDKSIAWLIAAAESTCERARQRAILRISALRYAGLLTSCEEESFGTAIWARTAETGLPHGTGLMDFAVLQMHEPSKGAAKKAFRDYYLSADVPNIRQEVTDDDGNTRMSISFGQNHGRFFQEVRHAASNCPSHSKAESGSFIEWTPEEARVLFDKAVAWWQGEGQDLKSMKPNPWLEKNTCKDRIESIFDFLVVVVTPRCTPSDSLSTDVTSFVNDLEASGCLVDRVLPALATLDPETLPEMARRIRRGLLSPSWESVGATSRAIYDWLISLGSHEYPQELLDLVKYLGSMLTSRRQPVLRWAMHFSAEIIDHCPDTLGPDFVDGACLALEFLFDEAKYRELADDRDQEICYKEVVEHRKLAVFLASRLRASGLSNEPIIDKWLSAAKDDPLHEVRNEAR